MKRLAPIDLTGRVFGCFRVLRDLHPDGGQRRRVRCLCACGKESLVRVQNLLHPSGKNIRCLSNGCLDRQRAAAEKVSA